MRKVPSIVQILTAEFLMVLFLAGFVGSVWNTVRPGAFGEFMTLRGVGNWVAYLLGFALFAWLMREIFQPRIKKDSWVSPSTWATSGGTYGFCSTHPSYVFVDLIVVSAFAFLLWYAKHENLNARVAGITFTLSLIVPALRLFAWYVVGLRIKDEVEAQDAWKSAAWMFIPAFGVFALIGVLGIRATRQYEKEIANMPLIDEQTFSNSREAFARLADGSREVKETGFVRVHATQLSDAPVQCKNKENVEFATVLADLGAGGDVFIVGSKYDRSGFDELVSKASGNRGKPIEVVGKLREKPWAVQIDRWKAYCGFDQLPPTPQGGRWVLEMKQP
jgi:hypothetical protein